MQRVCLISSYLSIHRVTLYNLIHYEKIENPIYRTLKMYGTHKQNMKAMRKAGGASKKRSGAMSGTNTKGPKPPYPPR